MTSQFSKRPRNESSERVEEKERMVEQFKEVFKEKGAYDFQSHVKYLTAIADYYHWTGAHDSDWVCLVKAHALYNSAAARDEENGEKWSGKAFEVQKTYWGEKVQLSYKQQKEITDSVRKELTEIRENTQTKLDYIKANYMNFDCDLDELQSKDNKKLYKVFMEHVEEASKYCTESMVNVITSAIGHAVNLAGEPPCKFCVAALGSIARGEGTPYSDLEFLFLLETSSSDIMKYFELLALTVYFLIGNLQETKLRYMAVEELDFWFQDEAVNGLKIDGLQPWAGNIPTGNGSAEQHNHFICTVDQLASKYEDVLNHPHPKDSLRGDLTAMLSCLVPVFGETELLLAFKCKIQLLKPNDDRQSASRKMLENDVKKFKFYPDQHLDQKRHMKFDIYRFPSMLILNLKIIHQLDKDSMHAIDELVTTRSLSKTVGNHLHFAFCCALYIRLSAYLYHNSQNESISLLNGDPEFLATGNQWHMDRSLLLHMMIHLMPLKRAVLNGQLSLELDISSLDTQHSVGVVSYYAHDYETAYGVLMGLGPDEIDIRTEYPVLACCANKLGYHIEAEDLLSELLDLLFELHGEEADVPEIYHALDTLGCVHEHQGSYEEAEKCHTRSLEMKRKLYSDSGHTDIAYSYNNLGNMCDSKGDYVKAKTYHSSSLEMRKRIHPDADHPDVAASLTNLAIVYLHLGDYTEAEVTLKQSLDMERRMYGNIDHPHISDSYSNLGIVYCHQGAYKEAEFHHRKALGMRERLCTLTYHPLMADSLVNLGVVFDGQGKYKKAEEYHTKALEMYQIIHNSDMDHPNIAASYTNLGLVHDFQGHYQTAKMYYMKSLNIDRTLYGDSAHPDIAITYNNLGCLYDKCGDYKEAGSYHTKSLEMRLHLHGTSDHSGIADCHTNMAEVYCNQKMYQAAEEHCQTSLGMMKRIFGESENAEILATYSCLGKVYCEQGDYVKAEEFLAKSQRLASKLYDDSDHTVIAEILNSFGRLQYRQGLYEESEMSYNKSMEVTSRMFNDSDHPILADSFTGLGSLCQIQGRLKEAELNLTKALEMRQRIFDNSDHPEIADSCDKLAEVLTSQGESEKAALYRIKCSEMEKSLRSRHQSSTNMDA